MASFKVQRASERDLVVLDRLVGEASKRLNGSWPLRGGPQNAAAWLASRAPVVTVGDDTGPIGFAVAVPEDVPLSGPKSAQAVVYVTPAHRRKGAGRAVMGELISVARVLGLWKLVAYALPEDLAATSLLDRIDFRLVGVLVKHVQIEGTWRDVALHERLAMASRKSLPSIPGN
jgi:L-amino acid N-acyltransferase YncA